MKLESRPSDSESIQRELAARARAELQKPQPDWVRVQELAGRALELSGDAGAPVRGLRPEVEVARERAEATLGEVGRIVAEGDPFLSEDNMARVCFEHAQQAYDKAAAARTPQVAIDGFRLAEESAQAAREHAVGLRAEAERKLSGTKAANLFWGAFGRTRAE